MFPSEEEGRKFKRERCFLISTLVFFTISYFMMVVRNILLFRMMTGVDSDDIVGSYLCKENFRLALFNVLCDIVTELIPYTIIFCLNLSNFREIERRERGIDNEGVEQSKDRKRVKSNKL